MLELFQRFRWYCKDELPTNGDVIEYVDAHIQEIIDTVQNKSWSEEDKEMSRFIGNAITAADASMYLESKGIQIIDAHVWLEDLKDRVQPQPKQEWSEEDEEIIDYLIDYLESELDSSYTDLDKETFTKEINWLKSLRPQNRWKPSDEHYELEEFAKIVRSNLTGISKAVQELFKTKYLQLTGNKMYGGFKD